MKILELRFKNLNSLYGEWRIDFTDPEYIESGIFALTGPTGAGKSTILDAICLAMYGATPRLGKITKSTNEVMSRQTGECYAEVMFASQAGRFRCFWGQHRARKKVDGNLIDARHEISDAETKKPIETKKSLVSGIIEEKTGMDFDRFTRSILLAQGGFDTFLKADVEQKSRILEQITGTEIYSEISRRVHERQRDEREKLHVLKSEISGIVILESQEEKKIQQDLVEKQKQETVLAARTKETGAAIAWLTGIDGLKKEISSLSEETQNLDAEIAVFKPERERLDLAMKAARLDGEHATLTALRNQQAADQMVLQTRKDSLPNLEKAFKQQAAALKAAEQKTRKAKEGFKQAGPLIQKVRSLDQALGVQKKTLLEAEKRCKNDAAKIASDTQCRQKEKQKRLQAGKDLDLAENYLKAHSRDEWLVSGFAGIEEQVRTLLSRQKEITLKQDEEKKAETALQQSIKRLADCTKQCAVWKQKLEQAVQALEHDKKVLNELLGDRLLREYRTEKETLLREMVFFDKIARLEEHRAKLKDGNPCPLCGAREHPFAAGNVPEPDETEKKITSLTGLIKKAEDQEAAIKKREAAESTARKNLADREKLETAEANEKRAAEKNLSDVQSGLRIARKDFAEHKKKLSAKLQPLGIEQIPDSDLVFLRRSLQDRLENWQIRVEKKMKIEKQLFKLDSELMRLDALIDMQTSRLDEKQKELNFVKKEYAQVSIQRQQLFGDKTPDDEEKRLNKAIDDAEGAEKEARKQYDDVQQKMHGAMSTVAALRERIQQRDVELKNLDPAFEGSLQSAGFTDEKQFLSARLTANERDGLQAKAKELDNRQVNLAARQKDRKSRLDAEMARKITDKTMEELVPLFKEQEDALKQLWDAIAGVKHKLAENHAAKERIKEKQAAIEARKKECQRWEKLHGLIGSADGKKYRNFAQGLTFELMVSHANCQLEKMTDRYLLIRDDEYPLELNVVDNYQAGEIRSTRNLSGGESFIVSLTLALGLSRMSSRKVRVDSLFLDEGFGTLDEEVLETALETLSGLQQDGKLIGIISHVAALKERIPTQITITPMSGGKSILAGPGCSRIKETALVRDR